MRDDLTKSRVHLALAGKDPRWGRLVAVLVNGAILGSALVVTLQSLQGLPGWAAASLRAANLGFLAVFVAEYALRLWAAPSRRAYATSFWGIVDLISILPALLFLFPDLQAFRTLRLFRAIRLLKLLRMRRAVERIEVAFRSSRDELLLFTAIAAIVLFLAAVGIYHVEHEAQPENFGSIPQSLWWAIATLTTVGYGDVYPVTPMGRIFTGLTLLVGLGIVAIPAGVITSALMEAPHRMEERPERRRRDPEGGDDGDGGGHGGGKPP